MQKLLGRNYKWFYLASYIFKIRTNYRLHTFFSILGGLIQLFGAILVWIITISSGAKIDLSQTLTYFIVGNIFAQFCNSIVEYDLATDIQSGKLTKKLLNTSSLFGQYFWWSLGGDAFYSLWNILALGAIGLIFWQNIIWTSWEGVVLAMLLILLGRLILFSYQILTGCLAFWSIEAGGILRTTGYISVFCSGSLFPLNLIRETYFLQYTPFAYFFFHPMQIYLGKYDQFQTLLVFLGGLAWCVFLFFLSSFVFHLGLKRNESVGL